MTAHRPITSATCTGNSYVLTAEDAPEGFNKLGMDVSHIPLDVPLCGGCDHPLDNGYCASCEVMHLDAQEPVFDITVKELAGGRGSVWL